MNDWGPKKSIKLQSLVPLMNLMMDIEMAKNYRYRLFCHDPKTIASK